MPTLSFKDNIFVGKDMNTTCIWWSSCRGPDSPLISVQLSQLTERPQYNNNMVLKGTILD